MGKGAQNDERWLQKLIAAGLCIGIGKRELLNDYYMDEIGVILEEWNALKKGEDTSEVQMDAMSFLGEGGEWIDA